MAARSPLNAIQFGREWHEQSVAGLRDATAKNDHLGIEEVDA